MPKFSFAFCVFLLSCLFLVAIDSRADEIAPTPDVTSFNHVKGSEKALKRLNLLFETMGGRESWAQARSLYIIQRTRSPRVGDGVLTMSWHDLEAPGEWADLQHSKFKARLAWSEQGGWFRKDGDYRDYIDDEIKEKQFYWHRDLYTLYHRLAKDEMAYRIKAIQPYGFVVLSPELEELGEFHLTRDGELYKWRMLGAKKDHTILFGAYRSFGETRFPDWMANAQGDWSAYQIQVMPSPLPFREQVSLKKPVREWQGGAVQSNCESPELN